MRSNRPPASAFSRKAFDRRINSEVNALCRLDNWHAPLALVLDFALIAAAILMVKMLGWALYPLAILVIGSRQRALATIVHEAAHGTLSRNKSLTRVLATVFSGYPVFYTLSAYKASHVRGHHGCFADPDLDPDYRYMLEKGIYDTSDERTLAWEIFIKPCLLWNVPSYLAYLRVRTWGGPERSEGFWLLAYWAVVLAGAALLGQALNLLLFWIVPFLTTFQIIGWFIELAEHGPLMHNRLDLHMTRNRNSHWLEQLFTGMHGESYHLAHHLRPRVPFWNMPQLHGILLRDPQYQQWDSRCGGIFLSKNAAPSVFALLMQQCREEPE